MTNSSDRLRTPDVLVVLPVTPAHRGRLESAGQGYMFHYVPKNAVTEQQVLDADIIIGNVPPEMIHASEKLQLLQLFSAGADAYVKTGVLDPKTILANAGGAYGKAVSEHAFALMLSLMKKLYLYRDSQRKRTWEDHGAVTSPVGAVVLIVGLGDIGSHFAILAKSVGATVIGIRQHSAKKPPFVDEIYTLDTLDDVLPRADVIFSVLPGTEETKHLYTAERFHNMKNSAYFINCGRGSVVAVDVLYEALLNQEIAGAAIDVAEEEPLSAESPLWSFDQLILTPHVAGGFHLPDTLEQVVDIACENLTAFRAGIPVRNLIPHGEL